MHEDGNACAQSSSPMSVRELLARLKDKDPDFLEMIDANSESFIILNPKPGFCSPAEFEKYTAGDHREFDQKFCGSFIV